MKIKLKKIKNILKFKTNDYKYLSPCVFKTNNSYQLLYSNRKSKIKFTGQIESAKSLNLTKWNKMSKPCLIPPKKTKYVSYVSPNIGTIDNKKILFIYRSSIFELSFRYNLFLFCKKKMGFTSRI